MFPVGMGIFVAKNLAQGTTLELVIGAALTSMQ
jgi:hypothetical protein